MVSQKTTNEELKQLVINRARELQREEELFDKMKKQIIEILKTHFLIKNSDVIDIKRMELVIENYFEEYYDIINQELNNRGF